MHPQKYVLPYGAPQKLADLIYKEKLYVHRGQNTKISADTIRRVCNGKIKNVCSEELAKVIYRNAHRVGGFKIPNRVNNK